MQNVQIINERQIGWLTGSILIGGGLSSIQNVLIRTAKTDTWFSYVLPTLYVFAVVAVFKYLMKTFPKKNLFDILFELYGRWGGGILNAVFIFHLWLILIRDLALFDRFFHTILLPRTPVDILAALLMFMFAYFGRTSLEVVARVNDVFFPLLVLIVLVLPLALSNEIHMYLVQPMMTTPYWRVLSGNLIAFSWFGDVFVLGAFLHMLHSSTQLSAGLRRGTALAAVLLSVLILTEVAVFGPNLPGNFIYPSYTLVQQIHITDFLDRVDLIMLMVWFPAAACKLFTIYLALLTGIASFMKRPDHAMINKPVALLLLISSLASFQSTTEVFSFGNFSSLPIVLAYQPLFLVLLLFGAKLYRKRNPAQTAEAAVSGSKSPTRSTGSKRRGPIWQRLSTKYPYPTWFRASNAVLAGLIVIVAAGLCLGRYWSWSGKALALLFFAGMIVFLFTTFAEMKTAED